MSAPLLLLHGFLGTSGSWDGVGAHLGHDNVRPVLPGHGAAPDCRVGSFDDAVDAIASEIARPVVVAGYSMGARLALGLAIRYPQLVRAAVLVGVNPGLRDAEQRAERRAWEKAQAHLLRESGLPGFVDAWERLPLFATQMTLPAEARASERARRLSHTAHGAAHAMAAVGLGTQPDLWPALARCTVPMTFLAGARDDRFSAIAVEAASTAPHGAAELVPDAGHNLLLEAPAVVARALAGAMPRFISHQETRP